MSGVERSTEADGFVEVLGALDARVPALSGFFAPGATVRVARAPGRIDVMGGIADYSGSLVLELPIREAALCAVGPASERVLRVASLDPARKELRELSLPLDELVTGSLSSYEAARRYFAAEPSRSWAAYLAGPVLVALRELGARLSGGVAILVSSSVPEGKGVSSSAAVEVATLQAFCAHSGLEVPPTEIALACQKAENLVAGAPCGVMDQMTAVLGRAGTCLLLRCQPAEVIDQLALPEPLAIFGIDSGVRHAVSGSDYTGVRTGAFMGYRILAEHAGLRVTQTGPGTVAIDDPRWHGYLANVTPRELDDDFGGVLPERMGGREFLERYGGITDTVTRVDPARTYAVRHPTLHPIYENARVRAFADLLRSALDASALGELGRLMYESHDSYSRCGLGAEATDRIVALVREAAGSGVHGAKITGGGSGGTVAVLAASDAAPEVERIAARYAAESGRRAQVFRGSSSGSAAWGVMDVVPTS